MHQYTFKIPVTLVGFDIVSVVANSAVEAQESLFGTEFEVYDTEIGAAEYDFDHAELLEARLVEDYGS